jgi:tetratricopeptide (TPR) repeat protein
VFATAEFDGTAEECDGLWGYATAIWGWFSLRLGRYPTARRLLGQALESVSHANSFHELGDVLYFIGILEMLMGEYASADLHLRRSVDLADEGEQWEHANRLGSRGLVAYCLGNYESALLLIHQGITELDALGDARAAAVGRGFLGAVFCALGAKQSAREVLQDALKQSRTMKCHWGSAIGLISFGLLAMLEGQYRDARQLLNDALAHVRFLGDRKYIAHVLCLLGNLSRIEGLHGEAQKLYVDALQYAWKSQAIPVVLDVVIASAWLVLCFDAPSAIELVGVVLHHRSSTWEAREQAERLRQEASKRLAPELIEYALNCRQGRPLEEVVEAAFAVLAEWKRNDQKSFANDKPADQ